MNGFSELDDLLDAPASAVTAAKNDPVVTLADGEIDPRLLLQSYSSRLMLHACPRKFQLYRLSARRSPDEDTGPNIHFVFGHAMGEAIQHYLSAGRNLEKSLLHTFLKWETDLAFTGPSPERTKKSFGHCLAALMRFHHWCTAEENSWVENYEVATLPDGRPACELSFQILLPGGFIYRGYMDLVLRHKESGEALVIELKSDGGNYIAPLKYKNSDQAIGYSAVLDKITGGTSSYIVCYLVYMTRLERWEQFEFVKSYNQRALWLRNIVYDAEAIEKYVSFEGNYGIWPQQGEACFAYMRPCEYMDICQLQTPALVEKLRESMLAKPEEEFDFTFTVEELLR